MLRFLFLLRLHFGHMTFLLPCLQESLRPCINRCRLGSSFRGRALAVGWTLPRPLQVLPLNLPPFRPHLSALSTASCRAPLCASMYGKVKRAVTVAQRCGRDWQVYYRLSSVTELEQRMIPL